MFEVTQRGETTTVTTNKGVFKIKFSPRYKRFQVTKFPSKSVITESFSGFQGALDIVSRLAA